MKKVVIAILILSAALAAGIYGGKYARSKFFGPDGKPASPGAKRSGEFIWGVQGGAYALNKKVDTYHPDYASEQIEVAKDLGVKVIRANLEIAKTEQPFSITPQEKDNDDYINQVTANNLDVLLVLDPDVPATIGKADPEKEGYKLASYAAARYKDKVKYYQIVNEVSGTIVKPADYQGQTFAGENNIEYSVERYNATMGWIKGMSRGIRENDPEAKIVLSGHWILYDVFNRLIEDGADFDILGWAWYSPDGVDVTKREYNNGQYMNLAQKLSEIKKDVWIIESNRAGGSYNAKTKLPDKKAEGEQADFFEKILKNVYESNYISGFFAFTLFDNPVAEQLGNPQDAHLGLAEVVPTDERNQVGKYKQAFRVYRDFIASHSTL